MSTEHEVADLKEKYSTIPAGHAEHVLLENETEVVDKGDLELCFKKVRAVKILPKVHWLLHTRHDDAHPGECHDFGISNYIVIRVLRNDPYPLDIYVCRREGCAEQVVQDPLSRDEIGAVSRRPNRFYSGQKH